MSSEEKEPKQKPFIEPEVIMCGPKKEQVKEYENELVQILPINDFVFTCLLIIHKVFTEDELAALQSQVTSPDSVEEIRLCLDHIISSKNFYERTMGLLLAMEEFKGSNDEVKKLAMEMRKKMHACELLCMYFKCYL